MTKQVPIAERIKRAEVLFQHYLPERVSELEKLWRALRFVQWSANTLAAMNRVAHTLAGSAGTLRYTELASSLKELDRALLKMSEVGGLPNS